MVLGEEEDNRSTYSNSVVFFLLLVSLHFAVIWGVRQQELLEIWSNFQVVLSLDD